MQIFALRNLRSVYIVHSTESDMTSARWSNITKLLKLSGFKVKDIFRLSWFYVHLYIRSIITIHKNMCSNILQKISKKGKTIVQRQKKKKEKRK